MKFFANLSIRNKIITLILLISGIVLIFSSTLFFIYDKSEYRTRMVQNLNTVAEILGNVSIAPLTFDDRNAINEYLGNLQNHKNIRQAVLLNTESCTIVGKYLRDTTADVSLPDNVCHTDSSFFITDRLVVIHPIMSENKQVGTIMLTSDLNDYTERQWRFLGTMGLILVTASLIALIFAFRFQRVISSPIEQLGSIVHQVTQSNDFTIRASAQGNDEVGRLSEGFNNMLAHIEQQNIALQKAKEKTEQTLKTQEQIIANISHEITTPLNLITGASEYLVSTNLTEQQYDFAEKIKLSADNLQLTVTDILDFSSVTSGNIEFENLEFNMYQLIDGLRKVADFNATKKHLTFKLDVADNVPELLMGDPQRLNQILINLLNFAFKNTQQGKVVLSIRKENDNYDQMMLHFAVSDTGVGIPSDKLNALLSGERGYKGLSLGLFVTKELVQQQGGNLHAESQMGKGSTFSFSLSFRKKGAINNPITPQRILNGASSRIINVLVVEDNVVNQFFASTVLKKNNFTVDIADNGRGAIEKLKTNDYDVILMDLNMPEMDGFDTVKNIRSRFEGKKRQIPIIALTSSASTKEIERSISIGMSDYIAKPYLPNDLIDKILKLVK